MKRKRFDRDIWNFGKSPYYQYRVDTDTFHGLVCALKLLCGNMHVDSGAYQYWERPKAGRVAICGRGMTWLQLVPDGKKHALTVMYLPDNTMSICYVDMIENIEFDADGVAVFIDKYLDVDFTPQGDVNVYDRDELDEAFASGELSAAQYHGALEECDKVIEEYCRDIPKSITVFDEILALVKSRMKSGEPQYRVHCR